MPVKMTGMEFKDFWNDDSWCIPEIEWVEKIIEVNSELWSEESYNNIPDNASVKLISGYKVSQDNHNTVALEGLFKKWRKGRNTAYLVVRVPRPLEATVRHIISELDSDDIKVSS